MNKQKLLIIILSVCVFALVQYVVIEKVLESEQQKILSTFHDGYEHGINDAINAIYQQTANCQSTKISANNLTKTILDLSCLNVTKGTPHP
ncbi:MAG: hypothetical protein ACYC6W_10475 [Nitrosotalea sp.]